MTAHSLIYGPVYRAAALLNKETTVAVELDWVSSDPKKRLGHGDEGALERLVSDERVDLCVCDPQVLVSTRLGKLSQRYAKARILAVLVARPALWMLRAPSCVPELRQSLKPGSAGDRGSIANQLDEDYLASLPVNLGRICTYDKRSSARAILGFMKREGLFDFEENNIREVMHIGEELAYMSSTPPHPVDVVVTCDCVAAHLFTKSRLKGDWVNIFAWHRNSRLKPMPFSAIIGKDLAGQADEIERRKIVGIFLREVDRALKVDILEGLGIEQVVKSFLDFGFPPLPLEYVAQIGEDKLRDQLETNGIQILTRFKRGPHQPDVGTFFPPTTRPDRKWVRQGLLYSASKIWRPPSRHGFTRLKGWWTTRRVIRNVLDRRTASLACPQNPLEWLYAFLDRQLSTTTADRRRQREIFCALAVSMALLAAEHLFPPGSRLEGWGKLAAGLNKSHVILGFLLLSSFLRRHPGA